MIQRMANPATSKLKVQPDIIYMNMSTLICWYMRNCVSSPVSLCNDDRRWYFGFKRTRSSNDKLAPDQTIILGLQIFLDHRSLSSIDQNILMTTFWLHSDLNLTTF